MDAATIESTLDKYLNEIQAVKATPLPPGIAPNTEDARVYLNGILSQRLDLLTQTITNNQVTAFITPTTDSDAIFNDIIYGATIVGHLIQGTVDLLDA